MSDLTIALGEGVAKDNSLRKNSTNLAAAWRDFDALPDDANLRPDLAAEYLQARYGFSSPKTLAKLRSIGGGPEFRKIGPQIVIYTKAALDKWARAKIGSPVVSTSHKAA